MRTQVLLVLWAVFSLVGSSTEQRSGRRKPDRPPSAARISPDPVPPGSAVETDFEKSIEDMVEQVRNNPSLSVSECVVDRRLWMSNSRSLSPWSYRISYDEARRPVEIPEAVCSCVGCINPFSMQEDRSMSSALIYSQIPVRRLRCHTHNTHTARSRRRKKCVPRFRPVMESVAVGCTCIVG